MRRDLSPLFGTAFDLLVIGAGIQGACIAWDACLRGLRVALVDRADFGAGTSANSLGIVHGGLRYLARGDFPRMLESIRERSTLLRIAPELVEPLPVLVPTYRGTSVNRIALGAALRINDLVSHTRNRGLKPNRSIPRGRLVAQDECLRVFPWFPRGELTGGAIWYDARLRHPERLTFSFVRSAADRGAAVANYVRVDKLLVRDGAVVGASVTDLDQGSRFEIEAHVVVVAAGPWTPELMAGTLGRQAAPSTVERALAVNVRIERALANVAVGIQASTGSERDPICGGHRFMFAVPHDGKTVLGTWYALARESDPAATVEHGVQALLREFNQVCPGLELSPAEVTSFQWGWLPLKGSHERGRASALAERPRVVDHGARDGVRHLLSVEAVKYTTARKVGERVVNRVFRELGRPSPACRTAQIRLGDAGQELRLLAESTVTPAAIQRAVHQEMVLKLSDIVFRRTSPGIAACLPRATLAEVAKLAGAELGWNTARQELEIDEVMRQQAGPAPVEEPVG